MAKKTHPETFKKVEETKNYIVQVLRDAPKGVRTYRRKVIYDKDGYRHIVNLAVVCGLRGSSKKGKRKNCKTVATSIWHPKHEPKAKKLKQKAKKLGKFVMKKAGSEVPRSFEKKILAFYTNWF